MPDGGDSSGSIIIKGGSVELSFDGTLYLKDSGNPGLHKHESRKITRIQVDDETGKSQFDSGTTDEGLKWTIKVSTSA